MNASSMPPPDPDADTTAAGNDQPVVQEALPLDGAAAEQPIPFSLTARARRVVAPESLPDLAVVTPAPGDTEPDTRAARARALRRSGRSVAAIAAALAVDAADVARWTDDVTPDLSLRRRGRHASTRSASARPVDDEAYGEHHADAVTDGGAEREAARRQFAARADAGDVPTLVAAGIVAATCEVQRHAVILSVRDLQTAAAALRALAATAGVAPSLARVTVVAGAGVARDLERARWARGLGVPDDHVTVAPWADAPRADAVRATIRLADRTLAATVEGWQRAALAALASADDERPGA
ncbi:MAG: hypothetical protein LC789_17935 [Actinobacteria bacterium]|nr:hypothetical protein [Actinomycetota bacterium]